MRILLIAVLSLAVWFSPVPVSATQVQPPLSVVAVSMWATPLVPGTQLDPSDPQVLDAAGSALAFSMASSGRTLLPQDLDTYYEDTIESLPGENGTIQEVVVPQYGQGCRAASIGVEGLLFETIACYDDQFLYVLSAFAADTSPSALPILTGIADQMFDPLRPDQSTGAMQMYLEGFAPVAGSYESLLIRLPQRAEVPAEYQLLDEEVIIL